MKVIKIEAKEELIEEIKSALEDYFNDFFPIDDIKISIDDLNIKKNN